MIRTAILITATFAATLGGVALGAYASDYVDAHVDLEGPVHERAMTRGPKGLTSLAVVDNVGEHMNAAIIFDTRKIEARRAALRPAPAPHTPEWTCRPRRLQTGPDRVTSPTRSVDVGTVLECI